MEIENIVDLITLVIVTVAIIIIGVYSIMSILDSKNSKVRTFIDKTTFVDKVGTLKNNKIEFSEILRFQKVGKLTYFDFYGYYDEYNEKYIVIVTDKNRRIIYPSYMDESSEVSDSNLLFDGMELKSGNDFHIHEFRNALYFLLRTDSFSAVHSQDKDYYIKIMRELTKEKVIKTVTE